MHSHLLLAVLILFHSLYISFSDSLIWNYGNLGPDVWPELFPTCGGTSQSPINIKTACTTYQVFDPFQFSTDYDVEHDYVLTNNGHTIVGSLRDSDVILTLTGGGLGEPFIFSQFHVHWGENYKSGSEHQLNGQKYSGEAHFVHTNVAETRNAVLGLLMQADSSINSDSSRKKKHRTRGDISTRNTEAIIEWRKYFTKGEALNRTGATKTIRLTLSTLIGRHLQRFYRYSGSLTTPPCSETVTWTVFETPIMLPKSEFDGFRTNVLYEDYRGPQPLNGRSVYRSFPNATRSTISDYNCCL